MLPGLSPLFSVITFCIICLLFPIICNKNQCNFETPDFSEHTTIQDFFDPDVAKYYFGYVTTLAILGCLPFGGRKIKGIGDDDFIYTMNGPFSFFTILMTGIVLEQSGYQVIQFIINNRLKLSTSSIICGVLFGLFLYIKSFYARRGRLNQEAINKNVLYGIIIGREINPRIFNLDVKIFLLRLTLISAILVEFAFIYDHLRTKELNPTLMVLAITHLIYIGEGLVFEDSWISTFEILYESCGVLLSVGYFAWPIIPSTIIVYVSQHDVHFNTWQLIVTAGVFTFGYCLYRASCNQKDTFRRNPRDPSVAHLKFMKTKNGKNLLISGYWGFLRHPNYLGDILIHLSICPIFLNSPIMLSSLISVVYLLQRTVRDNDRCKEKYGSDWDEYCKKVKYILIPGIY